MNNNKIINIANHNIKKAHDDVSERLLKAKNSKKEMPPARVTVFTRDGIVYLSHQNMIMGFTPEDAIAISEAVMTAGWELKTEMENENVEERENTTRGGEKSGEPTENEGCSEGQEQKED